MKSNQLWLRRFVSIILNAFLRGFAISAFLKVIYFEKKKKKKIWNFIEIFFSEFSLLGQEILDMGVFMEVSIVRIWKHICRKIIFGVPAVLGAWMTFNKAEIAKTLRNGLSMIETNSLNHYWLDFVILLGLVLHQLKKTTVKNTTKYLWKGLKMNTLDFTVYSQSKKSREF